MRRRSALAVLLLAASGATGVAPSSAAALTVKPALKTADGASRLVVVIASGKRFTRRTRPRGVTVAASGKRWTLKRKGAGLVRSVWSTRTITGTRASALLALAGTRVAIRIRTLSGTVKLQRRVRVPAGAHPPPSTPVGDEPGGEPPPGQAPPGGSTPPKGEQALAVARRYLGTPFVWGGASPTTGFDSPGLTQYAYSQVGVALPRTAYQQFTAGTPVARSALLTGDLVFFGATTGDVSHVGIFAGGADFVHAPHTGDVVRISSLDEPYYAGQFAGARHIAD